MGFSILEILIAMAIIAGMLYVVIGATGIGEDKLQNAVELIERTVRFSNHESALQGSISRIKFGISEDPAQISVQAGSNQNFILPDFEDINKRDPSLLEQEKIDEKLKKIDQGFQPINEYSEKPKEFPSDIKIIGFTTNNTNNKLQSDGDAYMYFYPSGEKDNALIIIAGPSQMVSLEFLPFTNNINKEYYNIETETDNWEEFVFKKAKDIFEKWSEQ